MSSKKLFYPFDYHSYPLIHYLNLKDEKMIIASEYGSGLIDRDIAYSINNPDENIKVSDMSKINEKDFTDFIVLDGVNKNNYKFFMENYQRRFYNKNIFEIKRMNYQAYNTEINTPYHEVTKPVIMVGGLFDSVFNGKISVELKYYLENLDIKCEMVSSDINLTYINSYFFDPLNPNYKSIPELYYYLSRDINLKLSKSNADIIIAQIPGGFMPINPVIYNDFGQYFNILNDILDFDYMILTIPSEFFNNEVLEQINNIALSRYNKLIDQFYEVNFTTNIADPYILHIGDDYTFTKFKKNKDIRLIVDDILRKLGD